MSAITTVHSTDSYTKSDQSFGVFGVPIGLDFGLDTKLGLRDDAASAYVLQVGYLLVLALVVPAVLFVTHTCFEDIHL